MVRLVSAKVLVPAGILNTFSGSVRLVPPDAAPSISFPIQTAGSRPRPPPLRIRLLLEGWLQFLQLRQRGICFDVFILIQDLTCTETENGENTEDQPPQQLLSQEESSVGLSELTCNSDCKQAKSRFLNKPATEPSSTITGNRIDPNQRLASMPFEYHVFLDAIG